LGRLFLDLIHDVIFVIIKGGLFMHIKKRAVDKQEGESKFNSVTYTGSYSTISEGIVLDKTVIQKNAAKRGWSNAVSTRLGAS
jgi:hypothetical protein